MFGPKHIALYVAILIVLVAAGWFVARGRAAS
jgi:hypothetical protein